MVRPEIDPRVALAVALVLGSLAWHAGPIGLAAYTVALLTAVVAGFRTRPSERRTFLAYARFTALWVLVKWGFDLLRGVDPLDAAASAVLLGWRMLLLLVLGLALALACSARGLGAALAWALRPVLRNRAWEVGLALALMVHFLPEAWRTLAGLRDTVTRRAASLSWWRRQAVLAQATLRVLAQLPREQELALAARQLDRPEAWETRFPGRPIQLAVGAGLVALAVLAARL